MKYECKAIFKAVGKDFKKGKVWLSFLVDRATDEVIQEMLGRKLRLIVEDYVEPKSLTSLRYMWRLTGLIATAMNEDRVGLITKEEVHREHINQFNKPHLVLGEPIISRYPAAADMSSVNEYLRYYYDSKDGKYIYYYKLKGASDFTSKEMTEFLQQIVIPDAHIYGIETATPDELAKMEQIYEKKLNSKRR